jgi:hypothetical protein
MPTWLFQQVGIFSKQLKISCFPLQFSPVSASVYPYFESMQNTVHDWDEQQGEKSGKGQTKDNGPGQGTKKIFHITADMNLRIKLGQQCREVNIKTDRQRY